MKSWRPAGSGVENGSAKLVLKFGDGWIDVLGLGVIYGIMGLCQVLFVWVRGGSAWSISKMLATEDFLEFNWLECVMCAEGGKEMDSGILPVLEAV